MVGRSHGPLPPSPPTEKAPIASDQRGRPSPVPRLCLQKTGNGIPPGVNILLLGFLYPLLNIGFGRPAKAPFPCDLSLCKIMTIPVVFTSFMFPVNKASLARSPHWNDTSMSQMCPISHGMANKTPLTLKRSQTCPISHGTANETPLTLKRSQTCPISHRTANKTPLTLKRSWNCAGLRYFYIHY